jgi:peptidoglycan/LPS O-acetylase OafA/YrhL
MDISANPVTNQVATKARSITTYVAGKHIPALDGIRGTAILLVVIHHLTLSIRAEFGIGVNSRLFEAASVGWVGVDLFFVLSGFLITGLLFDQKTSDHYFKNFYMRRALRIFPLYYGALLLILVLRALWPEGGQQIYGTQNPGWMWVYMTNFIIASRGNGAFGFVDHFWSLAIEEHFYLFWPLVVFLFNRKNLMRIAVAVIFGVLGLRIVAVLGGMSPDAIYILTPLRLDALCLGALIALIARGTSGIQTLVRPAKIVAIVSAIAIGIIAILRGTFYHNDPIMQTAGFSLIALFFGSALVLGLTSPLQHVFNTSVLRWFGKYSYGIYVWHPIIFILLLHTPQARDIRDRFLGGSGPAQMVISVAVAIAVTFVVTMLSWNLWESQFLKLKRYFE